MQGNETVGELNRRKKGGALSKAKKTDPNMLSQYKYEHVGLDAYFTPEWCVYALLDHMSFNDGLVWEPFVGIGNIAKILKEEDNTLIVSDIKDYGYPNTMKCDFRHEKIAEFGKTMARDFTNFKEKQPRWIVTNPPYTDLQIYVEHILSVCEQYNGGCALLLRNEFDCAKSREHIFQGNEAYFGKILLTKRPQWFQKSPQRASPRHNFSWYIWDYKKAPFANKTIIYSYRR